MPWLACCIYSASMKFLAWWNDMLCTSSNRDKKPGEMVMIQQMIQQAVGILVLVVLGGCVAWEPTVGPQVFHVDPMVERARPHVYVAPLNPPMRPLGCICYPFEVRQNIDNAQGIGRELGRVFWDQLVSRRPFGLMLYADVPWPGMAAACSYARTNGVDLVAMGTVSQFMQGGSTGTTSVALEFRIYEAETQTLIWSTAQAGRVEGGRDRDYMVATATTRMPQSPEYLVLQTLAADLGGMLTSWTTDPAWPGAQ